MSFASRMSRVTVSPTLKVAAEADKLRRQGVDIVDLGAGELDVGRHHRQAGNLGLADYLNEWVEAQQEFVGTG